jgi:hypothetical protein
MSLHPVPLNPSAPYALPLPSAPDTRLEGIARALFDAAVLDPGPTDLVGIVDVSTVGAASRPGDRPDHLVVAALTDPDPVVSLLNFTAPPEWWALGLVTGARSRALDGSATTAGSTFVHLVDRRGTSVSVLTGAGPEPMVVGPTADLTEGRLADACRRMLDLPTAPAPGDMTAHVIDLWLARVTRSALDQPGLDWPAVVARNPAHEITGPCTTVPTPAAIARRTVAFGEQLDWERYRQRCIEAGGTPFGELDAEVADWMDAGMFARWLLGESMPWPSQMDLLEGVLAPGAADRLWATLALCPPAPWPPIPTDTRGPG